MTDLNNKMADVWQGPHSIHAVLAPRGEVVSMKPRPAAALETQIFLELVAKIKIAVALESGVLDVKCPCGMVILPPTPVIPNIKDRQRGRLPQRSQAKGTQAWRAA
jgi:hypothetical protein